MGYYTLLAILSLYVYHRYLTRKQVFPSKVPWVGLRSEWFPLLRAHWRDYTQSRTNLEEGYNKYSKRGFAFVTPNFTHRPQVILPPSQMKWMMDQPDNVFSIHEVLKQNVQFDYTSPHSFAFGRPFHVEALNKMRLDAITPIVLEEIEASVAEVFGTDTETWIDVPLYQASLHIMAAITNRVFAGKLAHDKEYASDALTFVQSMSLVAFCINNVIPAILVPVLGSLVAQHTRYYDRQCSKKLVPLIKERLARAQQQADSSTKTDEEFLTEAPTDLLSHIVRFAVKSPYAEDKDAQAICSRLLSLNYVGIHTSQLTLMNCLLDVMSAPSTVWSTLREEAAKVLKEHNNEWTKAAVNKLVHVDSTFRESMRLSIFKGRGVEREVVVSPGLTTPDGTFLPKGTKVGLPTIGIQHDPDNFEEPLEFKPFRFVGKSEFGLVNANETFLAFGMGRHSCPGRFFSALELKLILAHLVLTYDVEFSKERPESRVMSDFFVPPNVCLRVKGRKVLETPNLTAEV